MEKVCPKRERLCQSNSTFPRGRKGNTLASRRTHSAILGIGNRHDLSIADTHRVITAAREALGPWVAQLRPWDIYATLTYDPKKLPWARVGSSDDVPPPSPDASKRHVRLWLDDVRADLGREIGGFFAMENHKSGWPHWHGLLWAGGLSETDFARTADIWWTTRGYAKFSRVDRTVMVNVAAYCAKYLTKETGDVLLFGRLADGALPGQQRIDLYPGERS
jgi:hypothetical protein